jgi:hypothetical protein
MITMILLLFGIFVYGSIGALVLFSKIDTFGENEIYSPLQAIVLMGMWPILIFRKKRK